MPDLSLKERWELADTRRSHLLDILGDKSSLSGKGGGGPEVGGGRGQRWRGEAPEVGLLTFNYYLVLPLIYGHPHVRISASMSH